MTSSESRKQYEFAVSENSLRVAITRLATHLCDLVEQALIDEDANEFDSDFDQYCHNLRLVLANRPDEFDSSLDGYMSEEADIRDPME